MSVRRVLVLVALILELAAAVDFNPTSLNLVALGLAAYFAAEFV